MDPIYLTDFHAFLHEIETPDEVVALYKAVLTGKNNDFFQCENGLNDGSLLVKSVKSDETIFLQAQLVRDAFMYEIKTHFTGGEDVDVWYAQAQLSFKG
ncbi:hypothetical protein ACSZNU_20120 [Aeromonas hydrophila]